MSCMIDEFAAELSAITTSGKDTRMPSRRTEVVKRLTIVNEQRTTEAKQKAIEQMERALRSPAK